MEPKSEVISNNEIISTTKKLKKLCSIKFKNKTIDTHDQIFKIVLTGLLLSIAVAFSLIEIKIPIMGAILPLRIFDIFILVFSIPIIGVWYASVIAVTEPWLHFAFDSDHPPIQMFFDNIANLLLVFSFFFIFYKLMSINSTSGKSNITKKVFSGLILVPFNALITTLGFVLTLVVLNSTTLSKPEDYVEIINAFFANSAAIFFILFAIEFARFLATYLLFTLVQKKLTKVKFSHRH